MIRLLPASLLCVIAMRARRRASQVLGRVDARAFPNHHQRRADLASQVFATASPLQPIRALHSSLPSGIFVP